MHFPRYLLTKAGCLSIAALVYVVGVLPLVHPFLHGHLGSPYRFALQDGNSHGVAISVHQAGVSRLHPACRICVFLNHFNIHHSADASLQDLVQAVLTVPHRPNVPVFEPFTYAILLPRPPPAFAEEKSLNSENPWQLMELFFPLSSVDL